MKVAVVGGGLSGLAAAHRLLELKPSSKLPLEVSLFEASPQIGGVMGTRQIGGYVVETGADSFITNKPWAVNLCERLGVSLIPTASTHRGALVLRNGKPLPVPEGFQLLAPAKVWPVLASRIFSPWGKLRMGLEYLLPRGKSSDDESLAAFVRRRFGREALERLVQPLVGGIYTSDPEKLSLKATMPRFLEMEAEHRSLIKASRIKPRNKSARETQAEQTASGARYGLFATPQGGISNLLEALANRVREQATVQLGTAVEAMKPTADSTWELTLRTGEREIFEAVILAIPAYRVAELLQETHAELADLLTGIEYASTAIVVSGHRLADISHPLDAFGLVIPAIEQRRILAVSFTSRKFPNRAPEGCVQLRTFVGGAMQPELLQHTDEELIRIVREELRDLLGVGGEPDFVHIARWNRAMPQYHLGHLDRVAQINACVNTLPGLFLAGNAYQGVGVPDCIHSGEQASETLLDFMSHA